MSCVLSFDFGTGGVKASLFNETGMRLGSAFKEYETFYTIDGFHEQNPEDWWRAIINSIKELLLTNSSEDIVAIGLSGHSLGVVPIDENGNLLCEKTPIWSDTRAISQSKRFFKEVDYKQWYFDTGCGFPAHLYSLFKIMWYKENLPQVYNKTYKFLGTKDYINYMFTGVAVTDYSYASGSGAYSLLNKNYIDKWITAAGVHKEKLADIVTSNKVIGKLTDSAAKTLGLKSGIPVVCGGVDNSCMALGAGCITNGDTYASLGTSAWVTVASDKPILNFEKKPYTFAHCIEDMYIPSVGVFSSGSALKWVLNTMFTELCSQSDPYKAFTELAIKSPVLANYLMFLPHFAGGSSVDPSPNIRGSFIGLHLAHKKSDIARSVLEGIAYDLKIAYDVLSKNTTVKKELLLVGGGAKSSIWRQIYADIFGIPTAKTDVMQDAAALGAAALGAVGVGLWENYSPIYEAHKNRILTPPDKENYKKYKAYEDIYINAIEYCSQLGDKVINFKED